MALPTTRVLPSSEKERDFTSIHVVCNPRIGRWVDAL